MKMNDNLVIYRNKKVITHKIGEEFIILDTKLGRMYKLNPTAVFIWKMVHRPMKLGEIAYRITEEYLINEAAAKKEVIKFIKPYLNSLFFFKDS